MIRVLSVIALLASALPALAEVRIKDVVTPGGITAWLVEDHSIPFVAIELRFRGGTSLDPVEQRGAVNLMTGLLEEGAADLDARGFARAAERMAAQFRFNASDDEVSISAQVLTENRQAALDLLKTAIHDPRFDADAIERVRQQVLSGLRSDATDPNDIARDVFSREAFGDHPYGSPGDGMIDTVSRLTRDDLLAAHRAVFAKDRLYVGAVGDITAAELGALIDDLLADLPETGGPIPGPAELLLTGGITVVEFETPQSVAIFGQAGLPQDDPDFFAAYVLNQVLGGGSFESRLMTEVREKRGLTYGVYSYLAPKDLAAVYLGSVSSANGRIAEAIQVIRDEWAKAQADGVTPDELRDAKTYLTGAYPLRFDGNARIANIMVGMQMQGLPIDYIATRNDKVEAVTLDDVRRVAADLLQPDNLRFVVVGQPEGLPVQTE